MAPIFTIPASEKRPASKLCNRSKISDSRSWKAAKDKRPEKKGQEKTGSQKLEGLKKIVFFCLGRQLKEFFQVPICSNLYFFCGDIIVNPAPGQRKRKPYSSSLPKEGQQHTLPKAWRVYKKKMQISSVVTLSVIQGCNKQTPTNN